MDLSFLDIVKKVLGDKRRLPVTDPRAFGPIVWRSLHTLAAGYPVADVSEDKALATIVFLYSLGKMLPCSHCQAHWQQALDGTYLPAVVRNRQQLFTFLLELHNSIRRHTRPDSASFTFEEAVQSYTTAPIAEPPALIWHGNESPRTRRRPLGMAPR